MSECESLWSITYTNGTTEYGSLTFKYFSNLNKKRCESPKPNGFNENIKEFGPDHWIKAVFEEVGEISGAILGMSGKKERKKHLTREDALDEIGDAVACLDLLAQSLDSTLGECAIRKFNKISDRIGSNIKID